MYHNQVSPRAFFLKATGCPRTSDHITALCNCATEYALPGVAENSCAGVGAAGAVFPIEGVPKATSPLIASDSFLDTATRRLDTPSSLACFSIRLSLPCAILYARSVPLSSGALECAYSVSSGRTSRGLPGLRPCPADSLSEAGSSSSFRYSRSSSTDCRHPPCRSCLA